MRSDGLFPLTLTLSLRERERPRPRVENLERPWFPASVEWFSLSPGERAGVRGKKVIAGSWARSMRKGARGLSMNRTTIRQVLECASPLALCEGVAHAKAAGGCRTPRRWRAGESAIPVHGPEACAAAQGGSP